MPATGRARLGAVSFLHRFGSALNHVHLHACATDGVVMPADDGPAAFLPGRPITQADLATLTESVRRRVVRWFRMQRLIVADAAAAILRWDNSAFSVDAGVRITLIDRDVPSYFQRLELLLRDCARPAFAPERLRDQELIAELAQARSRKACFDSVLHTGDRLDAPRRLKNDSSHRAAPLPEVEITPYRRCNSCLGARRRAASWGTRSTGFRWRFEPFAEIA